MNVASAAADTDSIPYSEPSSMLESHMSDVLSRVHSRQLASPQHACRNAWNHLGNMSQQSAMQQYIDTLQQQDPQWQQAAAAKAAADSSTGPPQKHKSGVGGPVFSTLASSEQQQVSQNVSHTSPGPL